jgi:hypothetical protein
LKINILTTYYPTQDITRFNLFVSITLVVIVIASIIVPMTNHHSYEFSPSHSHLTFNMQNVNEHEHNYGITHEHSSNSHAKVSGMVQLNEIFFINAPTIISALIISKSLYSKENTKIKQINFNKLFIYSHNISKHLLSIFMIPPVYPPANFHTGQPHK